MKKSQAEHNRQVNLLVKEFHREADPIRREHYRKAAEALRELQEELDRQLAPVWAKYNRDMAKLPLLDPLGVGQ